MNSSINIIRSQIITLLSRQNLGVLISILILSLGSEWIIQSHLYGEVGFGTIPIVDIEISEKYIAAFGVLIFSKALGLLLFEKTQHALFFPHVKAPSLGWFRGSVVWGILLFASISGIANGYYTVMKANESDDGFGLILSVLIVLLFWLLSLLSMLSAGLLFAVISIIKPVRKLEKEKKGLVNEEILLLAQEAAQEKRKEENERQIKEVDKDLRKQIEIELLKRMGLDKETFINTFKKDNEK